MTKKLIVNQGTFETYLEIKSLEVKNQEGWYTLKFTSKLSDAKDPTAEQTKYELFLEPQEFARLKDLINEV